MYDFDRSSDDWLDAAQEDRFQRQRHRREMNGELGNPEHEKGDDDE